MSGWRGACALVIIASSVALVAQRQECPAKLDLGEKIRRYTGHYENAAYGFSVDLPDGLVGLDTDDPDHQRGFALVLPRSAGAIWVTAETNSGEGDVLRAAAMFDIQELRKRAARVFPPFYMKERIAGQNAQGVSARFVCQGSRQRAAFHSITTLDRSGRFIYDLTWEGPAANAGLAERTMRALERSWRFIPAR